MKYLPACRQLAGFTTGLESALVNTAQIHRRSAGGAAGVKGAQGDGLRNESTQIAPRASTESTSNAVPVILKLELREKSNAKTTLRLISQSQGVQIKKVSESPRFFTGRNCQKEKAESFPVLHGH